MVPSPATLRSLAKCSLLILDDWMRDAISIQDAQNIFEVLDDRFGNTATLIATQVPITEWHRRIPDPTLADAILDRLVHNAHRIELKGESQRKITSKTDHVAHLRYNPDHSVFSSSHCAAWTDFSVRLDRYMHLLIAHNEPRKTRKHHSPAHY